MPRERPAFTHVWPVRVYYEDTDAGGAVYHANYLRFAERARSEWLRTMGLDHRRLRAEHGVALAVRDLAIDYRAPARLDDALEVRTRALGFGGAALLSEQTICRGGAALAALVARLACVRARGGGDDGRPARLPAPLRAAAEAGGAPRLRSSEALKRSWEPIFPSGA